MRVAGELFIGFPGERRFRRRFDPLRANIAETTLLALITEQGENRNQREKQWIVSGSSHGFACRGT